MQKSTDSDIDETRREILLDALSAGLFASGLLLTPTVYAGIFGSVPKKIPKGKSIYKIKGIVQVNGKVASTNTLIRTNDTITTGDKSQVIFVVGKDAFILRSNSNLKLSGKGLLIHSLRMFTGKMLSVFGRRPKQEALLSVTTPTATIGIRGTGVYFESEPDLSYVCTCYGTTQLQSQSDPSSFEEIISKHHDAPRYITRDGVKGNRIQPAPVKNHTDLELMLIEELVGRVPPFSISDSGYSTPRRNY